MLGILIFSSIFVFVHITISIYLEIQPIGLKIIFYVYTIIFLIVKNYIYCDFFMKHIISQTISDINSMFFIFNFIYIPHFCYHII